MKIKKKAILKEHANPLSLSTSPAATYCFTKLASL